MKGFAWFLTLCTICSACCAADITYDTSVVWDEDAFGFAFYFAETSAGRTHDDKAYNKFLDALNNSKEQTINNLLKMYHSVFQNVSQSEETEFVRTLVKTQNKVTGSNLNIPDINNASSLTELLNKANQTCERARDKDGSLEEINERWNAAPSKFVWGGAKSSYEVYIKDNKNKKQKLISQSDYETGKYNGSLAGIKFSAQYKEEQHFTRGLNYTAVRYNCVVTCMLGESTCGLIEHRSGYASEMDEQYREQQEKKENQVTKDNEKREKADEQAKLKEQEQKEKNFQELYKIKYKNPNNYTEYLDTARKMCFLEARRKLSSNFSLLENTKPNVTVFVSSNGKQTNVSAKEYKSGVYPGKVTGLRYLNYITAKYNGFNSANFGCEVYCKDKKCIIDRFGQILEESD